MRLLLMLAPVAVAGAALGVFFGPQAAGFMPAADGHGAWYASRGAGVAAYLFLWLGLVGGLLMSSAWFDGLIGRARLLAIHQSASIAAVLLGLAHGLVLMADHWTHFGPVDVLVPFASYYRTSLTALGTVTLYLAAVISATFWLRGAIGARAWRLIHYTSFLVFLGALFHGVRLGTDSGETWLLGLYVLTSLTVVFGLVIRLTYIRAPRRVRLEGNSAA